MDISSITFQDVQQYIAKHYPQLSSAEVEAIETATRGQADKDSWHTERRERLTASCFGKAAKCVRSCESILKTMLYVPPPNRLPAFVYGRKKENVAVEKYVKVMEEGGGRNVVVNQCGVFIHAGLSYLGASPDRLVTDPNETPQLGVLEVKCPKSMKNYTISEACGKKTFCCKQTDGKVYLKKNHEYFYQIQGQMFITNRQWCDFVVYTKKDIHIERVMFDATFWDLALKKLQHFVRFALVPELILRKIKRKGELYSTKKYVAFCK